MPRGGRKRTTWTKATRPKGGRTKGSKDKVSRTFKGTLKSVFEDIATEEPELVYAAVRKGLKAPAPKSFQYLHLMTAYIDGKPTEALPVEQVRQVFMSFWTIVCDLIPDTMLRVRFRERLQQLARVGPTSLIESPAIDAQPPPPK